MQPSHEHNSTTRRKTERGELQEITQYILAIRRHRHKVGPAEICAVPVAGDLDNVAGVKSAHGMHPGGGGFAEVGKGGARRIADVHCPVRLGVVGLFGMRYEIGWW